MNNNCNDNNYIANNLLVNPANLLLPTALGLLSLN